MFSRSVLSRFGEHARGYPPAKLQRDVVVKRAGVRLLIGDAQFRQHVQNDARLDFKLPRQLINANFTHI